MGREHVVIGGHDPDIGQTPFGKGGLVGPHRRIGMGLVPAGQMRTRRTRGGRIAHAFEIFAPLHLRPVANAVRHTGDG